ncbi:MAG: hypothetical protein EOP06_11705 [Proteobacteria bacterium]|nr:MAG: hypothetical protein EOP06_11705 [Pseudomonadota bacterium]
MKKLNNKGVSIIENMIALAMLGLVFLSLITAFTNIFSIEARTTQVIVEHQIVAMIIESVKSDPSAFEKNFANSSDGPGALSRANLTMGYKKNFFGKKSDCPGGECDKLVGFTLIPDDNYKGLFQGTVLIADVKEGGIQKEYQFLVNSN